MNHPKSLRLLMALVVALLASACSRTVPRLPNAPERTVPWNPELVEAMASLPVQRDGRVMCFATLAAFTLYHVHGRRDLQHMTPGPDGVDQKVTLEPTEWLLDVWFYPRQAADYPLFRIENVGVLDALGFANDGQTQGFEYLSYAQLFERGEKLQELADKYREVPVQKRSEVEEHLVQLFQQLLPYHFLHQQLAAMQADFAVEGEGLRAIFGGKDRVRLGDIVRNAGAFRTYVRGLGDDFENQKNGNLTQLLAVLNEATKPERGPLLLPPTMSADKSDTWHSIGETVDLAMRGGAPLAHVSMLGDLQDAIDADSVDAKSTSLRKYRDAVVDAATSRGEYGSVSLEAYYYRASWHYRALHWFLFGFVLAAFCWLFPRSKVLWWGAMGVSTLALGMLVADVWLRCEIRGRPPITNLYDTFLFIGGVGVLVSLVTEWVLPRRIALALGPFLGALLIMFARMFEVADGQDTLKPLVAVLDSNFWLATHVTIINIGYASGLVAAALANVCILGRVLRLAHPSGPAAKALVRMVYGVTCFGLLFAVVGTILGGVWANDSWGRFWGWDPKENGALLICLSQIAFLHARFSGMVRDFGVVVWASVTGMIVLFSWFHTNLLGVGLHNYGFSSGLRDAVWTGYSIELGVILAGTIDMWLRPKPVAIPAVTLTIGAAPATNSAWPVAGD
ncbi:MAG: cytochrome c biogenesis protein CcsA [Planctomycetota bacterium]